MMRIKWRRRTSRPGRSCAQMLSIGIVTVLVLKVQAFFLLMFLLVCALAMQVYRRRLAGLKIFVQFVTGPIESLMCKAVGTHALSKVFQVCIIYSERVDYIVGQKPR